MEITLKDLIDIITDSHDKGVMKNAQYIQDLIKQNDELRSKYEIAAHRIDSISAEQWRVICEVIDSVFARYNDEKIKSIAQEVKAEFITKTDPS